MITTSFREVFPNVISHHPSGSISGHHEHKSAKNGDLRAAMSLVNGLINPQKLIELGVKYSDAILVPIIGVDENLNKIPLTYAIAISRITGLEVEMNIIKSNETAHTNKGALERMLSRACFEGNVKSNKTYILVDDVITTGGTLNEMRNFIEENGGRVVAVTSLGNAQFSTILAIQKDTIEMIERKFGRYEAEKFIQEIGIGGKLEHLTNSEGRYILSFSSIERIRERALEIRNRESLQILERGIRQDSTRGANQERGEERKQGVKTLDDVLSRAKERVAPRQQELKKQINKEPHRKMSR